MIGKQIIKPLPEPFATGAPKWVQVSEEGKDITAIYNDANSLTLASLLGGKVSLMTHRGERLAERLAVEQVFSYIHGETSCRYADGKMYIDMPEIEGYTDEDFWLEKEVSPEELEELLQLQVMNDNTDIMKFLLDNRFKDYRDSRLAGTAFGTISPLDIVMQGAKRDFGPEDLGDLKAWFTAAVGLSDAQLQASILGLCPQKGVVNEKYRKFIEPVKEYLFDTDTTELMRGFDPVMSEDRNWLIMQLPTFLGDDRNIHGFTIDPIDILVGRKYYLKGNKTVITRDRIKELQRAIEGIRAGESVATEDLDMLIDFMQCNECRAEGTQIVTSNLFLSEAVDKQTGVEKAKIKRKGIDPWVEMLQNVADTSRQDFLAVIQKAYKELFEPGFVRCPSGILFPYKDGARIVAKTPKTSQEKYDWVHTRCMEDKGVSFGELCVGRPSQPEDGLLFMFFGRALLNRDAYFDLQKADSSLSIQDACRAERDSDIPVCTQTNHERIVDELYRNFKDEKDFTYIPMLMAEFAFGTTYKNKQYVETGQGWSNYKPYITQTLSNLHLYGCTLCLIDKARAMYKMKPDTPIEQVTKKASEEGLFGDSEEAMDRRQQLVWSIADDKIKFINYMRNSLMICSILRVHERTQDKQKNLVQYRVRVSDVMGTLRQEKLDCANPAKVFSSKAFRDSEGAGVENRNLLDAEDVTPSGIEGITQIIETGDLFDVAVVEGTPVFAYKEAALNAINGYYPIWETMPLGRKFDGQPVLNSQEGFLGNIWHMIIAGSRSGKGVMSLTHLAYASLNKKTIIYLDNKPDMYSTLVSLLSALGENDPRKLGLLNGGRVQERYDLPITRDTDKTHPFLERFKGRVLGDVNASWTTMRNQRGEQLIPEYTLEFYNGGSWERGFGDMVYYRLFTLLNGVVYARIMSQTREDNLKQFGGMCFFIDEYNEFQAGFQGICEALQKKVMMPEDIAESLKESYISKEVSKNEDLSEKSSKKVSEDEAYENANKTFFKTYGAKVGPANFYASYFFRTVARGLGEMSSLTRAGGTGGTVPVEVSSGLDMYVIGQEPKMEVLRTSIDDSDEGVDTLIGKRYSSLNSRGAGVQRTSDNKTLQPLSCIPMSWTDVLQSNGVDACFGYNKKYGRILNQNKELSGVASPSQSKLTENARYFGYIAPFNLKDTMPKYDRQNDGSSENVKFMASEAKRATYLKPYLILNDNDHTYTDGLTNNIVKAGVSKRSIFATFGDDTTKQALVDDPEISIIHTLSEQAKGTDDKLVANYNDGVGLIGYMDVMCDLMRKEREAGRTEWETPENAQESMLYSFHKGAELLQFITDAMGYPGDWLEFLCDLRYSWMFTPADIAHAIIGTEYEKKMIGCLGARRELGLPVEDTWIDKYWKQYADYDPAPASEDADEQEAWGMEQNTEAEEPEEKEVEISLTDFGSPEGMRKTAEYLSTYSQKGKPANGEKTPPVTTEETPHVTTEAQGESTQQGIYTSQETKQIKDHFTADTGKKDLLDQLAEIFMNKQLLDLLVRMLPTQVAEGYRSLGQGKLVDECERAIQQPVSTEPESRPQTLSEEMFARNRKDYDIYVNTPLITESKALTIVPEENIILGKDLRKPVTQVVYDEIGERWGNMKSMVVNGNEELIVNGKRIRTYFDADSEGYINPDMMDELNVGMVAKYFDYRYLSKCKNLDTLVIVDKAFAKDYIAPVMGMRNGFNIEDIFAKCPSLQNVYVGNKCYTRKDHKRQCANDYTIDDYRGDMIDNFRYLSLSYKDKQWHAFKRDFGNMPRQFAKTSRWEKVFTIGRGIKNVAGAVASGVIGAGLNGISSVRRAYQNTDEYEEE